MGEIQRFERLQSSECAERVASVVALHLRRTRFDAGNQVRDTGYSLETNETVRRRGIKRTSILPKRTLLQQEGDQGLEKIRGLESSVIEKNFLIKNRVLT